MGQKERQYCRTILLVLLSSLFTVGCHHVDVDAQNASNTATGLETSSPPKKANYYWERYGVQPVPALLNGKDYILIDGWIKKTQRGQIAQGRTKDGAIKYRMAKVLHVEPIHSRIKGYRLYGEGYRGEYNKHPQLSVGNSYLFKMKPFDQERFALRIRAKDPNNHNFYKLYSMPGTLNNPSTSRPLLFTPTQDTPEEIEFSIHGQHFSTRRKFRINKYLNQETQEQDQVELKVDIRDYLKKLHIVLQEEGFYPSKTPENPESILNLHDMVKQQLEAQTEWLERIKKHEKPGFRLLYVHTDPTSLIPRTQDSNKLLLETRKVSVFDGDKYQGKGKKFLIRCKTIRYRNRFIDKLLEREKRAIRNKESALGIPKEKTKGVYYYTRVGNSYRYRQLREEFEDTLNKYKDLTIEYAVEDAYLEKAKNLVSAGKLDEAIELLRPHTYPLVKLVGIPETYGEHRICNFEDHVIYLLTTLIMGYKTDPDSAEQKIGYLHEAFLIIYQIHSDFHNHKFVKVAKELADLLEGTENHRDMARAKYIRYYYVEVEE